MYSTPIGPATAPTTKTLLVAVTLVLLAPLAFPEAPAQNQPPVSFNDQIRPLLNRNCTSCHGGVKQAGDVSFIHREQALGKGKSGNPVVVPGKPEDSELIYRITAVEEDERMPPVDEHPQGLSSAEIELLTEWVRQGAIWDEHWSFQAPQPQPLPAVDNPAWPKQPLDHFVLARLEAEELTSSDPASPAEWLRRASFDLTGLPPSADLLQQLEAVAAADDETAYTRAADALLASPAFGERWAALWMDLARYADSAGFEKDPHRDVWPYRDWLIRAFNDDLPFDQFTVQQLAGDLLENPTPDDLIATAFHRNTMTNTEGGTDDEEFRVAAVSDRINTTWTVWQGLTFGCVQCHDHPYDPFRHEEYYQFMDFFNSTEDCDLNNEYPVWSVPNDPARHEQALTLDREHRTPARRDQRQRLESWPRASTTGLPLRAGKVAGAQSRPSHPRRDGHIRSSGTIPTSARHYR